MMTVEILGFDTAYEFIETLRRSNKLWTQDGWDCNWIFRGQSDSCWQLVPSAWRTTVKQHPIWGVIERDIDSDLYWQKFGWAAKDLDRARQVIAHRRFEYMAMTVFAKMADELGFRIPGEQLPPFIPSDVTERVYTFESDEKPFHPALAMAQHHGMPTRLLDLKQA